jgi:hypothetical protein
METAADFHPLPPVERDGRGIVGKYVQEGNLPSRRNLVRDCAKHYLPVTATAVRWMHTYGRYFRVVGRLHSLARHRNKLSIDPNSKKRSQFMRSQRKGTGLREFG